MSDHVLGNCHVVVDLAIVHLELESYEARQNGGGAGLRSNRNEFLARLGSNDG